MSETIVAWIGKEDDRLDKQLEDHLEYGETKSAYLKHSIRLAMAVDDILGRTKYDIESYEERRSLIRQALHELEAREFDEE